VPCAIIGCMMMRSRLGWLAVGLVSAVGIVWELFTAFDGGQGASDQAGELGLAVALVPAVVAAWARGRHLGTTGGTVASIDEAAEWLATQSRTAWEAERELHGLNAFVLPVRWAADSGNLFDSLADQRALALRAPGRDPGTSARWVSDATDLAGSGSQILEVFTECLPSRRLVVLGEMGSGKTILVTGLLLDLLEQREVDPRGQVPVFLPLASWNPMDQDVQTWMAGRLEADYPFLAAAAPAGPPGRSTAQELVAQHRVLPIFDGLDELAPAARPWAVDAIAHGFPPGQGFVLTCRPQEFRDAVATSPARGVRLVGAAGIRLLPVEHHTALAFLRRHAAEATVPLPDRWQEVTHTDSDSPLAAVLQNPLMLSLVSSIYNPRPGEGTNAVPDPAELADERRFPDSESIRAHLWDAFIPAAYRRHRRYPSRWSAQQAERTFRFLARHLERLHDSGSVDIAWWELHHLPRRSRNTASIVFGAALGLLVLMGLLPRTSAYASAGVVAAITAVMGTGGALATLTQMQRPPQAGLRWSPAWIIGACGLTLGPILAQVMTQAHGGTPSLTHYLYPSAVGALGGVVLGGWRPRPADLTAPTSPELLLVSDRRTFAGILIASSGAVSTALVLLLALLIGYHVIEFPDAAPVTTVAIGITGAAVVGLVIGLVFGAAYAFRRTAWGIFVIARSVLAVRGRVPIRFMAFLGDAHAHRGVLRRSGATYQFRHIELQRRLTGRTTTPH
jgi:hypothetical protein